MVGAAVVKGRDGFLMLGYQKSSPAPAFDDCMVVCAIHIHCR